MVPEVANFLARLQTSPAVLVTVHSSRGSVPRENGAWMAVFADETQPLSGTIGGGRLEHDAIAHARSLLLSMAAKIDKNSLTPELVDYALGPSLGQCCGGVVQLQFEIVTAPDAAQLAQRLSAGNVPLALFGGGHVGRALVSVLTPLAMDITWIDSRDAIFPPDLASVVQCEYSDPVQAAVNTLPPQSRVLIMSFSHAEDLAIVTACLERRRARNDLPYIGLIGSRTKWSRFCARLRSQGFSEAELAWVTCPIGIAGITDKRPQAIAVAVAAQLLQQ